MQSSELVANLFVECEPSRPDYHGLCKCVCAYCPLMRICSPISSFSSPTALWRNIFLLILTALTKVFFTAWTFGMMVGDPYRISLLSPMETLRSLLEFSYRQSRLEPAWGGPWDSSRKPEGWVQRPFTDQILGKIFKGHTLTPGYLAHALRNRLSPVYPLASIP